MSCAMNGAELTALDPRIRIQEIAERVKLAWNDAGRLLRGVGDGGALRHEALTVTVRFMIKEESRAERMQVITRINGWAREGWLTVSMRPGLRLYALCTQAADCASQRWNGEMELVFTACGTGCWEETTPRTAVLSAAGGRVNIVPRGTRPCKLEAQMINQSGAAIAWVELRTENAYWRFEGLELAAGKALVLTHDEYGVLQAVADGEKVMRCRTAGSADELLLTPGQSNEVRFSAGGACAVTIAARGVFD